MRLSILKVLLATSVSACTSGAVPPLDAANPASARAPEGIAYAPSPAEPASSAPPHEHHHDHAHGESPGEATTYACPMHPEVTSDAPGSCPKCGMTLVPKK